MKKLALAVAGALFLATTAPVFACPHDEDKTTEVKTADKDKAKAPDKDKANTADKDKAKTPAKDTKKKPDDKPVVAKT